MLTTLTTPATPLSFTSEGLLLKHPLYIRTANFFNPISAGLGTIHKCIEDRFNSSGLFKQTYNIFYETGKTIIPIFTLYKGALLNETWKDYHSYISGAVSLVAISYVTFAVKPGIGLFHDTVENCKKHYPILPQIRALIVDTAKIVLPLNVIYRPLALTLRLPREINIYATIFSVFYTLIENYRDSTSSTQDKKEAPLVQQRTLFYEACSIIQQASMIMLPITLCFSALLPFQLLTEVFVWTMVLTAFVYTIGRRTAEISLLREISSINVEREEQRNGLNLSALEEFGALPEKEQNKMLATAALNRLNSLRATSNNPNLSYLTKFIINCDIGIGIGYTYLEILNIQLPRLKPVVYRASRLITFYNHLLGQAISNKGQIGINLLALAYGIGESHQIQSKNPLKQPDNSSIKEKID